MKRQNYKKKDAQLRASRRRWLIAVRRRKMHQSRYQEYVVTAPEMLSFSGNGVETLAFFDELKRNALANRRTKVSGQWTNSSLYVDLSTVQRISIPTAVVLSAELHRWSIMKHTNLKARGINKWSERVRQLLGALRTFELLNVSRPGAFSGDAVEEIILLPLSSGEKNRGAAMAKLQSELAELSPLFEEKPYIFDGLSEAVTNCVDHAYPDTIKPKYPYAGHRWWATSCVDPVNNTFRFFVYDQGVGIPQTIDAKPEWKGLVSNMLLKLGASGSHTDIIESAFEVGRTRTGLSERGKGLSQMFDVIKKAGAGSLRIISGQGDLTLHNAARPTKNTHSSHIGGTLVEWSIPIHAFGQS